MDTIITQTPVPEQDASERERLKNQQLNILNQQLKIIQEQISALNKTALSNVPSVPKTDNYEELERQEDKQKQEQEKQNAIDVANQLTQQNQQLQQQFNNLNSNINKTSRRWVKSEKADAKIVINKSASIICDVAVTPMQQMSGLQAYDSLDNNRGLWFPQHNRKVASFHMGNVKFPIDIIFVDTGKINKIVSNISPKQFGSWSSICTDVIEVNAGWTHSNNINVGDNVETPLTNKQAGSEIERLVNTSWSAPQDARITSTRTTYDPLMALTQASEDEDWEEDLLEVFPFLKSAQENKSVKPNTYNRQPGEIDNRNPAIRFEHNTLPDELNTFGDGGSTNVDPFSGSMNGFNPKYFEQVMGNDPSLSTPERVKVTPYEPTSDGLKAPVRSGAKIKLKVDTNILSKGSLELFDRYPPKWNEDVEEDHKEMAVISDNTISRWIDSLDYEGDYEEALRQVMFTNDFKILLGQTLEDTNRILKFDLFDSDLLIYR